MRSVMCSIVRVFCCKQTAAYEIFACLVGSGMGVWDGCVGVCVWVCVWVCVCVVVLCAVELRSVCGFGCMGGGGGGCMGVWVCGCVVWVCGCVRVCVYACMRV